MIIEVSFLFFKSERFLSAVFFEAALNILISRVRWEFVFGF